MKDLLIDRLVSDLVPVKPLRVSRFWLLVAGGLVLSVVLMVARLGMRPEIAVVALTPVMFWKLAATLLLGITLSLLVLRHGRPGGKATHVDVMLVLLALALFWMPGITGLLWSNGAGVFGESFTGCLKFVSLAALVPLAGFLIWLRRAAPVYPLRAGALAGCAAGAFGGFAFAWYCPHDAYQYVSFYYSLPALWLSAIGAVATRILCKW
jgi:hypothetical protein